MIHKSTRSAPSIIIIIAPSPQVATFLLHNNYLLTALELLMESNEAGRHDEAQVLSTFFSDRTRFPPEALVKFEPHDGVSVFFSGGGLWDCMCLWERVCLWECVCGECMCLWECVCVGLQAVLVPGGNNVCEREREKYALCIHACFSTTSTSSYPPHTPTHTHTPTPTSTHKNSNQLAKSGKST